MTAGRPPHGLFCPSGRSLLAAHSYPALTRGHTTTLSCLATPPRLSPGPAIRPSSSSCPSYPALTRGHTTTLPCLATLPRLSPDPTHPATRRSRPAARPGLSPGLFCPRPFSPRRPSGRPPFQPCGTTRSVALPAARPPDFTATPSPVRPPLHLPSSMPLPYNRSPVHGSAFLTPRTPRSAARPPSRSATQPLGRSGKYPSRRFRPTPPGRTVSLGTQCGRFSREKFVFSRRSGIFAAAKAMVSASNRRPFGMC